MKKKEEKNWMGISQLSSEQFYMVLVESSIGKVTSEITASVFIVHCHIILSIGKCFILTKELS